MTSKNETCSRLNRRVSVAELNLVEGIGPRLGVVVSRTPPFIRDRWVCRWSTLRSVMTAGSVTGGEGVRLDMVTFSVAIYH